MNISQSVLAPALLIAILALTGCQTKPNLASNALPKTEKHWAQLLEKNYSKWETPAYLTGQPGPQRTRQVRVSTSPTRKRNIFSFFTRPKVEKKHAHTNVKPKYTGPTVKANNPTFHPNKIEKTLPKVDTEPKKVTILPPDVKPPMEVKNFEPLSVKVKKDISLAPPVISENIELTDDIKKANK